jgi:hypothetical protein
MRRGIESGRALDELNRLLRAAVLHLDHAQDVDGRGMTGIEPERVVHGMASLVEPVAQEEPLGLGAKVAHQGHLAGRKGLGH